MWLTVVSVVTRCVPFLSLLIKCVTLLQFILVVLVQQTLQHVNLCVSAHVTKVMHISTTMHEPCDD
jgi:hypothetical protein